MNINWKVRFRNKVWLTSFISAVIVFVYTALDLFGVIPRVEQTALLRLVDCGLFMLSMVGVIVDPTTEGIGDSKRAQQYVEPWQDGISDIPNTVAEVNEEDDENG